MNPHFLRGAAAAALLAWAAAPASGDEALKPCRVDGIKNEVQCGAVTRLLNPADAQGQKIEVRYVVVPAMARRKIADPVFMLAGGPGQSAIKVAPQVLPIFTRLNNRRDIVFVDQRGTGRSAPLECEDVRHRPLADQSDPQRQISLITECREQLQKLPYGDLRFFTTPIAMQDLDAVRRHLGVERIDLVGASYGTRAALDYLRQFPKQVRRTVIDGVAPPDMILPASFSTDNQASFDLVLAACEGDAVCTQAYPKLRADWVALLASLPKPATALHPLTGQPETFTLTREMVLGAVRGPLYSPALGAALPHAITQAARGRYEPLVGMSSLLLARKGMALSLGMHFSVVCAEDYPRLTQTSDAPGKDFSGDFSRVYERVCADWPRGEVPVGFYTMPPSASPVLLLSGSADPATPPRHGARAAKALGPKAMHVVVPNAGHGTMSIPCMRDVVYRFIDAVEDKDALAVDAGCVKNVPRPLAYQPMVLSMESPK